MALPATGRFNYRGVHAGHPALDQARQGIVVPADPNATISPDDHNAGGMEGRSQYTSWTKKLDIAMRQANRKGPGGLVLRLPEGKPPPGASWSWEFSIDIFAEDEILLRGTRTDAEVFWP
jgi:hypothetical protein